jgi:hypothetical protein
VKQNFDVVASFMVRNQVSEEIGLELSKAPYKALVRQTIDDFVQQLREEKEEDEEEEEEIEEEEIIYKNKRTYDDCGNIFICQVCFLFFHFTS